MLTTVWNGAIATGGIVGGVVFDHAGAGPLAWTVLAPTLIALALASGARRHAFKPGTCSVALAALKIAKARGARVAITSSQDAKLETARALGADITVNYRTSPDWAAEVIAQTGGKGADIVIETGGVDTLGHSIAAAAINARIIIVGVSPGEGAAIPDYLSLIAKNVTIRGIANGSRAMFVDLLDAMVANRMTTVVDRIFAFDDAPDAVRYFAAANHLGKVMIAF
jgi:NADPH:quinone reductase-like Zn-dependent oxidoreductase